MLCGRFVIYIYNENEDINNTFCSFLNEDAFIFSDSLTEKYCKERLRDQQDF